MPRWRLIALTLLALLAFAGNSLLCRAALRDTGMDAASFTSLRMVSGAAVLVLLVRWRAGVGGGAGALQGDWRSAVALFAYAACFSYAYLSLPASTGALLLFGAVQTTMIGWGLLRGERLLARQSTGLLLAMAGLLGLMWPGLSAPPLVGGALMLLAGVAWGAYSLLGKGARNPLQITAGNFARASVLALVPSVLGWPHWSGPAQGVACALASGALTSGLGYAIWYSVLPQLRATQAATLQLSVPVIAALVSVPLLGESVQPRLIWAALAVLGGIALVILPRKPPA